jgi:hypothetical protein
VPVSNEERETVSVGNPFDDPVPVARHSTNGTAPSSLGMAYAPPPYHSMYAHQTTNNAPPVHYCEHCRREIKVL